MNDAPAVASTRSIRRHLLAGAVASFAVVAGIGGLSATTELAGAVVASGFVVVESNTKKVQHPTGGIVAGLHVRDGDRLAAGDLLLRLDETITRANLAIVSNSIDELSSRRVRLEAERDGVEELRFPQTMRDRSTDPAVARMMQGELQLFELRRKARSGQKAQLSERIAQLQGEIAGLNAQASAKTAEISLVKTELEAVDILWKKNLVPISRRTAIEREATRLHGEHGHLLAAIAQARGKIVETELQIIQLDQDLRSEVAKELRELQAKLAELEERRVAAEDQLRRTEIRAPQGGVVHQLQVHTVGGVIAPGETVMLIVPDAEALIIEVRISPESIDQVRSGQRATVRFSAFDQGTTPELNGSVRQVSADLVTDARSGQNYFLARVAVSDEESARLNGLKPAPGMPAEVFIQTESRTVLSYLVKPLRDQALRAMRER